jgi:hypothetical protein
MTPQIIRERTHPSLRLVEASNFPCCIAVFRPTDGTRPLIVVSSDEPPATLRGISRLLLEDEHRRLLSKFLTGRKR